MIIDKHVGLFTLETFLHVYMTIFLVSIVHFENNLSDFLVHLITPFGNKRNAAYYYYGFWVS